MLYAKPQHLTCNRIFCIFISTFSFIKNLNTYLKKKHKRSELSDM